MRVLRHVTLVMIFTLAALIYVHQQIELVKLGYTIDCKEKKVKEMLDLREILKYNISNLESPSRLENALSSKKVALMLPRKGQIIRLARTPSYPDSVALSGVSGFEERAPIFRLLDLLGGRAEAHAREK